MSRIISPITSKLTWQGLGIGLLGSSPMLRHCPNAVGLGAQTVEPTERHSLAAPLR